MHRNIARNIQRYINEEPTLADRYRKIRQHVLPIKPSQYDVTNRCNLQCEGCFYFSGEHAFKGQGNINEEVLERFFSAEAIRGVNYAHFAGAEPALDQEYLAVAYRHIKNGMIYTNGTIQIDPSIRYKIQISLWGNEDTDSKLRGTSTFQRVIDNYAGDERVNFLFTISRHSLHEINEVVERCEECGLPVTFSFFSPTDHYLSNLEHTPEIRNNFFRISSNDSHLILDRDDLNRAYETIEEVSEKFPGTVRFHRDFNAFITNPDGLYRIDPRTGWALDCASRIGGIMKHFTPDLSEVTDTKCCTPNTECSSCRLAAMAMASAIDRLDRYAESRDGFKQWLNIIETWSKIYL